MQPVSTPAANGAPPDATLCPRCQKPLVDPQGLGWCQACGYCRSLAEDRARLPLAPAAPKADPAAPRASAPVKLPPWGIMLIAGMVLIAVGSWAAGRYIPLTPLQRAIWATVQAAVGILAMFAGQSYGLFRVAPEEETLNFIDAVIPFRLYSMVCKRLPRLGIILCIGSWGLALTLSGLFLIGGLGHWLKYLPKSQESQQTRWQ